MMLFTKTDIKQDTLQVQQITKKAYTKRESDSAKALKIVIKHKDSADTTHSVYSDTTSVCSRNKIVDVTYYDSAGHAFLSKVSSLNRFPFNFTEKNREIQAEAKATIMEHLKEGQEIPHRSSQGDWMTGLILLAAILYSLVSAIAKNPLSGVTRFFLFRGINDPSSRDIGGLFHWQSTVLNFISFMIISLFAYSAFSYYDMLPEKISGILSWLIMLAVIMLAVTIRHIISVITGNASEQKEAFSEYLLAVYQAYRFSALFLFLIVIMASYTEIFEASTWYFTGFIVIGIMYLIRITRLLIIFLNRKISIFYLILYLCALEILPVLMTVKYFTGAF